MTELWKLPEVFAEALQGLGIAAEVRYGGSPSRLGGGAAAAVSLEKSKIYPFCMGGYLGEEYSAEAGTERSVYARRADAELLIELYAQKALGEHALRQGCEKIIDGISGEKIAGLAVESITVGSVSFDEKSELFSADLTVAVSGYLRTYVKEDDQVFSEFEIRSELI